VRAALIILLAALPAIARAQSAEPDRARATALTAEGIKLYKQGDHAGALARFDEAIALVPSPRLHYDRALALIGLGRSLEAAHALEAFLADTGDAPESSVAVARQRLAELDALLGHLVVEAPIAAAVRIDGEPAGGTPATVRVDAGEHEVSVTAPGRAPFTRRITVARGATERVTAELPAPVVRPARDPAPPLRAALFARPAPVEDQERPSILRRWWFWTAVGAVAVAGGATAYFALRSDGSEPPDSALGVFEPEFH
jgi:hypothetical protein